MLKKILIVAAICAVALGSFHFLSGGSLLGASGTEHYFTENFYSGFTAGGSRQYGLTQNGILTVATTSYLIPTWEYLGSTKLSGAAATTSVVTIPARDIIQVCVSVPSYGGSDIASLRFNGDANNSYTSRYISIANGTTTLVDNATSAVPLARLYAVAQVPGRTGCYYITNSTTKDKMGAASGFSGNGTSTTSSIVEFGGFEWATTSQITSVQMLTAGGQTLGTGSGFAVFGKNF